MANQELDDMGDPVDVDSVEDWEDEPQEGDLVTSDHRKFWEHGLNRLAVEVPEPAATEEMWAALDAWMDENSFFPGVWFISDHGNAHLMRRS